MTHEHYVSKVFSDPSKNTTHGRIKWEDTGDISMVGGVQIPPATYQKGNEQLLKKEQRE